MKEPKRDIFYQAALAGLLHDIGKLEQRARPDPWTLAPGTEDSGQPVHATWSINFAEHAVYKTHWRWALMGAYHHQPERCPAEDKRISRLVALADKLSAGERADTEEVNKKPAMQLATIFDQVNPDAHSRQGKLHYLPLAALSLKREVIFPAEEGNVLDAYEFLRDGFRQAAAVEIDDLPTYLENLLFALQRFTWAVPSAYYHSTPDISLYDHCRMTAALCACLAERQDDEITSLLDAVVADFQGKTTDQHKLQLDQPVALLIGGDISGIQDFIYTISSKGAARMLRGRSFYLQLLTEAVLRFVLDSLDLPYCNVIYTGGGHFYLLAPVSSAERLPELRLQVTSRLWEQHGASLYLALGCAQVPASGFKRGAFPTYWGQMHRELSQAKQRRYTELGDQMYAQVFEPPELGGNPDETCDVCGEDHRPISTWAEEQGVRICSLCRSFFEDLGKPLPGARFIALGLQKAEDSKAETAADSLAAFGLRIQFLESKREQVKLPGAERVVLWAFDDPGDDQWPSANNLPTARQLRYTVNQIPQKNRDLVTFDDLQEETLGGFKRLGVLRMDVDNLGEIFKSELGEKATLARLAALSFQMSLYFEGWIKRLVETGEFANLIYAVYAGGDDVFLIGPWDKMPALAKQVNAQFGEYTAGHPAFHISAGMAFIDGKYPVYQAAEDADEALQQAKVVVGKNAFTFLGEAWPWPVFAKLEEKHDRLRHIVDGKEAQGLEGPQSILQILQRLADYEEKALKVRNRPVWGPWMWLGAYRLTRLAEQYNTRNPALAEAIRSIRDELGKENYKEIHQWGMAARWTQLSIRKKSQVS